MGSDPQDILQSPDRRVDTILDACTKCGACVGVCPTPGIDDGIDAADPEAHPL
jgi:ferredoxin